MNTLNLLRTFPLLLTLLLAGPLAAQEVLTNEHLIQMANQIAQYHEAFPEHAEAIEGIYTHLRRFWEPRMRTAIYAYLDQHHGEGLHPLVLEPKGGPVETIEADAIHLT